ncbi:MAG TPA: ABC transporter permease [Clostridiaceae bacterium]|nr:ABC transporter permease [Clostridiaceae bacterium]
MTFQAVWKRFKRRKTSLIALFILLFIFAVALVGPFFTKYEPTEMALKNKYAPVSLDNPLGTDQLGRDTLTRLIYGSRVSLSIAFAGVLSGCFVGVLLGVLAGYFGSWVDSLISRLIDVLLAFPGLLLAIAIVAILGNGVLNTMIAVAIFCVPSMARIVRGIVISLKNQEFVQACQVMGASTGRILFRHVLTNAMSMIIVTVTLDLGSSILTASALSFLGLGVMPPNPEWGAMLNAGKEVMRSYPLGVLAPGLAITIVVISFSLVGDGLRDALDPRLKNLKIGESQ